MSKIIEYLMNRPAEKIERALADPDYKHPIDPNYPENPPAIIGEPFTMQRPKK